MRLLLVEDDPMIGASVQRGLRQDGHTVDWVRDGAAADLAVAAGVHELILLDLGLPGKSGLEWLAQWRARGVSLPVLILTARDNWHEKVAGIDAGADDYLAKPFHLEELLARLRALIRRAGGLASAELRCGALVLDTRQCRASVGGQPLVLTGHEYRVLAYLMHRPGQVVSRSELIEHIYAQDCDRDSNTVEVFVARLRKKLPDGAIETVRGLGYRMVAA